MTDADVQPDGHDKKDHAHPRECGLSARDRARRREKQGLEVWGESSEYRRPEQEPTGNFADDRWNADLPRRMPQHQCGDDHRRQVQREQRPIRVAHDV